MARRTTATWARRAALALIAAAAACAGPPADPDVTETEANGAAEALAVADDGIPWDALARAGSITIRRTAPDRAEDGAPGPLFRRYAERAVTVVSDDELQDELLGALRAGVEESDGSIARCFMPRHAISAEVGGLAIDLLICFECYQIHYVRSSVGGDDEVYTTVPVTDTPREAFERLFAAAGI